MLVLDNTNFDETIASELVLVDFWAPWCGPCKMMLPILEEIDSEGKIKVAKLNADDFPEISNRFSVSSIPTMIVFKYGQPVHTIIGAMPKARLEKELAEWI